MIAAHVGGLPVEELLLSVIPVLGVMLTGIGAFAAGAGRRVRRGIGHDALHDRHRREPKVN